MTDAERIAAFRRAILEMAEEIAKAIARHEKREAGE